MEKPIILFDLNGTLCYRDRSTRKTYTRPYIRMLKELMDLYTVGIYTSIMNYNAWTIIRLIEKECKCQIFDRKYIFTRNNTTPFTYEEQMLYNISPWKTKKSINSVIKSPNKFAVIVDDEEVKIVEKDKAVIIPSYYEFNRNDKELFHLIKKFITF